MRMRLLQLLIIMNDHMGAHEQSLLAMEHAREAHRLSEEAAAKVAKVSKELENR